MFQANVCASYSPTSRFVMNAGATMNSTTPMTRPSTMENAISFLPNTASPSDFAAGSLAAAAEATGAGTGSETTSSERCAPRASIMVSGRPKSSFQENAASADPDTGASPSGSASVRVRSRTGIGIASKRMQRSGAHAHHGALGSRRLASRSLRSHSVRAGRLRSLRRG